MNETKSGARLRAEAAKAVNAVVAQGRSLGAVLGELDEQINPADRPLLKMLCYGTLRHHFRLRADLRKLLERPLKARDSVIESLLAIGIFQLIDTRIPDHAAVSMTVEAARLLRRPKYAGLINAVLRNFLRQDIGRQEAGDDESRFNHPAWFIDALRADWPDDWQQILEANNERAPMWLRVNQNRTTTADYLDRLAQVDDGHGMLSGFIHAIRLAKPVPVAELPGFADGDVSVQDAAAQIAAPWLLMGGGSRILDACAAPGGKTGHLLELASPGSVLTVIELDPERLASIHENLERLRLDATVLAADASKPKEWWDGQPFDRILLDAPCSASGVIRRHPDIKLLRRESDIEALAGLQTRLLDALWPLLAPSGRLLYVTCSVLAAENDAVVGDFLARHSDAREDRVLPNYNIRDLMVEKTCGVQVMPGNQGLDGFYFACLERTH
ncbi:16S rRNA m5C967 methyltransferase, S-adenosyl-L-methionine-dependent [uncultured Woeseiaceae bacterium]|uniref:16S rRNA (cytosine(967)-C(5))-methyltransferase n=1 Tax=uncultured Woeseiaceae bacterium TaxID=1983305 RepID=A0A7D9D1R6_9GAMM|nr:16S rRNA m5C967 methyltransferase, S-adenosyl-L-methionine-dependent [uncultured Woeseiaceae bacterium]